MLRRSARLLVLAGLLALPARGSRGADWPAYKADARRSSVSTETLRFPLAARWVHLPAQRPRPAWPEPGRYVHRIDFDYAFQPVVAGRLLYFGSSADDTVRALDVRTGMETWRFTADAPVRLAPHVAGGRCYFASDDGNAYCLDARTGSPVWRVRLADDGRMLVGNERIISRWPCRSGVLVRDDVVYATAGMWPSEGVLVFALSADTGEVIWCNDTTGSGYRRWPHRPSVGFGGPSPQGYLLASDAVLVVANGKAMPAGFDRRTGRLRYFASHRNAGGSWATITGTSLFAGADVNIGDTVPRPGEGAHIKGDGLCVIDVRTGKPEWPPNEAYRKATGRGERGRGVGPVGRFRVAQDGSMLYAVGSGRIDAFDCASSGMDKMRWTAEFASPRVYSVALSGNALVAGGSDFVAAYDRGTGAPVWSAHVKGRARGLAAAGGMLFVSTGSGRIYCFARGKGTTKRTGPGWEGRSAPVEGAAAAGVVRLLPDAEHFRGYALVIGTVDATLAEDLAARTELHVVCVLRDEGAVAAERGRLLDAGVYGTRVVVHRHERGAALPYAKHFANVVVAAGDAAGVPAKELYRVLRPCGGMMVLEDVSREAAKRIVSSAGLPRSEIATEGGRIVVRRGKLAGAFDWDSRAASDALVKWPLELLWFGGPGPSRMTARHRARWGGAPLTANGRYFSPGYHDVIAVDAYNGTELWSRRFDHTYWGKVLRSADDGSVYVARDGSAAEFDAQTGRLVKVYGVPRPTPSFSLRPGESREFETPVTKAADGEYSGRIAVRNSGQALELTLVTLTPHSDPGARRLLARDIWDLRFDFRRPSERLYPKGRGAFQVVIFPAEMTLSPPRGGPPGPGHDLVRLERFDGPAVEGGCGVRVRLSWEDVRELVRGNVRGDFTLGAKVTLWRGVSECVNDEAARSHPLTGGKGFFRDGAARFVTDPGKVEEADVPVGDLKQLPPYALRPGRQPPTAHHLRRRPSRLPARVELLGRDVRRGLAVRRQPVTGNLSERLYVRSYGCGGVMSSAAMDFVRSGVFSMYDLEDDSGLRDFAGVRMGCASSAVASQGVLIYSEGTSDCGCAYAFYSSFALAPADTRKHEDWAMFMDEHMDCSAGIREMALNFGAPGDRRDPDGVLWLHYPRRRAALADKRKVMTVDLPCRLEFSGQVEPVHLNADRTPVKGAGHPWVVSSALVGLRRATVELGGDAKPSAYTVRLHFAELREDVREGERVFDVRLQGRTVIEGLDVVAAAGGARTGIVYEYEHVPATDGIVLELVPKEGAADARSVPVVSGMAVFNEAPEAFGPPAVENGEARSPGYDSVQVRGRLRHDGRKLTSLFLKYGRTDGEWEKMVPLGKSTCGDFHVELVDLEEDTEYFYTFSASNAIGTVDARPSGSFSTLKAVPPTVLVELDAGGLEAGALGAWANRGSLGGRFGNDGTTPLVEEVAGVRCVTFDGTDRMIASFRAPGSITGREGWSCEVWAFNPEVNAREETMVSWAARPGRCIQVSYGHSDLWGALGTYSDPATLGWTGGLPGAGEWHHLVVTYQGGEGGYMKAYADGRLNARKRGSLDTGANEEVVLGSCREEGPAGGRSGWSLPFSGSLAFVRVYDGELTPSAVRERHRAGLPGTR